jgi:hypothetical protein
MLDNYCISTSTSPFPLVVNTTLDGTTSVLDSNGAAYYATTSCPAVISTVTSLTDNPSQDLFNGIVLFLGVFAFFVWYWLERINKK